MGKDRLTKTFADKQFSCVLGVYLYFDANFKTVYCVDFQKAFDIVYLELLNANFIKKSLRNRNEQLCRIYSAIYLTK